MAKLVHPLIGMTMVADLHGSTLRQPNAKLGFVELDRSVRNVEVLQLQVYLRNGCHQIRLQTQNLIVIHGDPGTAFEPELMRRTVDSNLMKGLAWIRAFFKTKLP